MLTNKRAGLQKECEDSRNSGSRTILVKQAAAEAVRGRQASQTLRSSPPSGQSTHRVQKSKGAIAGPIGAQVKEVRNAEVLYFL